MLAVWAAVLAATRWGPLSLRRVTAGSLRVGVLGLILGTLLVADNVAEYLTPLTPGVSTGPGIAIVATMVAAFAVAGVLGTTSGGTIRAG